MRKKPVSKMTVAIPEKGPTVPLRIHIPKDLFAKMKSAADIKGVTVQALILERIGKAFAVTVTPPRKGKRASQ